MIEKNLTNAWEELESNNYRLNELEKRFLPWYVAAVLSFVFAVFIGFLFELLNNIYFTEQCLKQNGFITVENHDLTCIKL